MPIDLTVKERVLLHLLDHIRGADGYEVPGEVTQEGIASAVWIDLPHVAQYVRPLVRDGLVREHTAHVRGGRRRRKAYDLTDTGKFAAIRLRERLKAEPVRVRDGAGIREADLGEVLSKAGGGVGLLGVLRQVHASGVVDLARIGAPATPAFLEMVADAPQVGRFVGRQKELEAVTADADRPRVFVVRGVAGIGKSTFGGKACEAFRGRRNLFWHRIRSWDTSASVLAGLGKFLDALGRPGLRNVVGRGESERVPQVLRDELPASNAVLVFDDAHEAGADVVAMFRFVKDAVAAASDVRVLVLTRRAIPFYDRRDVILDRLVQEIELAGLDSPEIATLLGAGALVDLGRKLGGHPLSLRLLEAVGRRDLAGQALQDVHRFLEEAVYSELPEPERRVMRLASLYRTPVPQEALFADPRSSHDVLLSLTSRALLLAMGTGGFEVHDTVREFFRALVSPAEQRELGGFATGHLRAMTSKAQQAGDLLACIGHLTNALELTAEPEERVLVFETLGELNERIGDLPAALVAFKEAGRVARDPEVRARMHRKTAAAFEARWRWPPARQEVELGLRALGDVPSVERGWLHLVQSRIAAGLEEWEEASEHAQAAQRVFHAARHPTGEAESLLVLGTVETNAPRGNSALAERHLANALSLGDSLAEPEFRARVHTALAYLHAYRLGDPDRARLHLAAVASTSGRLKDAHARRHLLMVEGWFTLKLLADFATAEAKFSEAMYLGRRIYDASTVAFARFGLAYVSFYRGDFGAARTALEALTPEIIGLGSAPQAVESLFTIAECCLLENDLEGFRAASVALDDPRLSRGVEGRSPEVNVARGLRHLVEGEAEAGFRTFDSALEAALRGFGVDEALVRFHYGAALEATGREAEAGPQGQQAEALLRRHHLEAELASLATRRRLLVRTLRGRMGRAAG